MSQDIFSGDLKGRYLSTSQAAAYLGVAASSLACDRCRKTWRIPFVRIGRAIRYDSQDLAAFVESRRDSN